MDKDCNNDVFKIKNRLKEIRKEKNWTQRYVAEKINKSNTGYASWEQGLAEPGIEDLRKLCNVYDISADYLLGLED